MTGHVLALVGPTASGKSTLALEVARRRGDVELVAVDAFTVYRGMDVATAKPSAADRLAVRHHLLDLLDPSDDASVAWFQEHARAAITDISARGSVALLVGGSGLYFRAAVDDLRFPPTDAQLRGRLEQRYRPDPVGAHTRLAQLDPVAAARIEPANLRRSVRALEVIELTGRPFSAFATGWSAYTSIYPGLDVVGLDLPDEDLRARAAARAAAMVEAGLLDEARALRAASPISRTAAQAIGYREAFAVLDGTLDPTALAAAITARTWRYARRQRAWLRADPRVRWLDARAIVERWA